MMMSHDNDKIEVSLKISVSSRSWFNEEYEYNQRPGDRKKTRDVTVEVTSNRKDN